MGKARSTPVDIAGGFQGKGMIPIQEYAETAKSHRRKDSDFCVLGNP
jgi:hypothetical protein